jgi:AraC-like DNA-binding protein
VLLPLRSKVGLRHAGKDIELHAGDFALLDDSVPYRVESDESNRSLFVAVSPATLGAYLPTPASICGLHMSVSRPLNGVASTMLLALWAELENETLPLEQRPALARSFLQVLAASYALDHGTVERSGMAAARLTQIKQYIEAHLRNPELTPTMISAGLRLSRRYLRLLFAAENDSISAYVRRRRLEECAFELAQPRWFGRSITDTASAWGFRSVTHFARAFKAAYGATPSAFQETHINGDARVGTRPGKATTFTPGSSDITTRKGRDAWTATYHFPSP